MSRSVTSYIYLPLCQGHSKIARQLVKARVNWIWLCCNAKLSCVMAETFLWPIVTLSEKLAAGYVGSRQLCQEHIACARDTCHTLVNLCLFLSFFQDLFRIGFNALEEGDFPLTGALRTAMMCLEHILLNSSVPELRIEEARVVFPGGLGQTMVSVSRVK